MTWRRNGAPVGRYVTCFGERYWHTQAMVQLPSKNGRAYFARTDSFRRHGLFYVMRTDADAYDPVRDYVKDTPGTDGEVVFLDEYWSGSPIGDWNHPGDMAVVGNLLVIAGQQWHSDQAGVCDEFDFPDTNDTFEWQDADAAVFYDVSDPENPKYLGKISEEDIGFGGRDAIDAVGLYKTTDGLCGLMIGGSQGTKNFWSENPWMNVSTDLSLEEVQNEAFDGEAFVSHRWKDYPNSLI